MYRAYYYLKEVKVVEGQEHYTVILSSAKSSFLASEKVEQFAKSKGIKLAGGWFCASCKPFNFHTNYTVTQLPKHFKAKKHQEDFIDRLIAYESGLMNAKQIKAFFAELKETGYGEHLQGHYSSRM